MGFLDSIFGKKGYIERDNHGIRQETMSQATAYWLVERVSSQRKDPYVLYEFNSPQDARDALLELPCIKEAVDSKKLICTEVLRFGYYGREDGKYEAIICGDDLTHKQWEHAHTSFKKHNGILRNDLEPPKKAHVQTRDQSSSSAGQIVFVREDKVNDKYGTTIYRTYKGPSAAAAKAFLEKNPVTKKLYYIVVETPEGNYGRDIEGMYKE